MKKTICFSLPCYNEKNNIEPLVNGIISLFEERYNNKYNLIVQFIDNNSNDGTIDEIRRMCNLHHEVRAILNAKNFPMTSGYYGILQSSGDCVIVIPSDFQVPLFVIPELINKWENGKSIVVLRKISTKEKERLFNFRKAFYKLSDIFTENKVIDGYNGCGLYESKFIEICRKTGDNVPNFIQLVSTLGYNMDEVLYHEEKRKHGRTKNNIYTLISIAIDRFISMSNFAPKAATIIGFIMSILSFMIGVVYVILKLFFWYDYPAGTTPILIGVYFIGSIQIFMIGLIGEYIVKINARVMNRPLVVEKERINFK